MINLSSPDFSKTHILALSSFPPGTLLILGGDQLLKNRKLARAIADVSLSEFRRQLTYKAEQAGVQIHVVSRWEPSSKTCSGCGWYHADLQLAHRVFVCQECGLVIDRDLNAARNLELLAYLEYRELRGN